MVSGRAGQSVRVPIVGLLKQTGLAWWNSNAFEVAGALAFYAIFSIAPVIVLAVTAASLMLGPEAAQGQLTKEIESSVGPTVGEAVQATSLYTYRSGAGIPATILSIIFFGFGATGFFTQLQSALNAIWKVTPQPGRGLRDVLRDRLGSFLTVLGTSTLLLAALLVTTALSAIGRILPDSLALEGVPFWRGMTLVVSWVVLTLAIALVYRVLPDIRIAWRDVWVGASVTGLLFLFGNHLIGWYLAVAGIPSIYGAAGSLVVVLLWVFYSSQSVLIGAEFTRVYAEHRGANLEPKEHALRITRETHA